MCFSHDNPHDYCGSGSISSFTWKRRGNLQGRQISAITKIWPPFITSVENVRQSSGNFTVQPCSLLKLCCLFEG